jgi:uncharacterized protein (DUF58 family)
MHPTGRTVLLALAAALSPLVVPVPLAVVGLALVAVAVAVDASRCRNPPEVSRPLPALIARGVPTSLHIDVSAPAPHRVEVRQPISADLRVEPAVARRGLDTRLVALRRGAHRLPPVVTRTTGPLGLARWVHRHGAAVTVTVHPDLPTAWRLARAVQTGTFTEEGLRRGPLGLGTEFEYVRDYSPDDDVRQINWRATLRLSHPMSNQYRVESDRDVLAALDLGRLMTAPVAGDRTRLDTALDALVAVGAVADVVGDRFGALAYHDRLVHHLPPRRRGGAVVAAVFHDVEPVATDSDHELGLRAVAAAKRALVVVFTDLLDEAAARALVGGIDVLCATHAVVVASALDPMEAAMRRSDPADAFEVYRNAVLAEEDLQREAVVATLQRAGATVVQAPPDRLPSACVAAYLRLKARARV